MYKVTQNQYDFYVSVNTINSESFMRLIKEFNISYAEARALADLITEGKMDEAFQLDESVSKVFLPSHEKDSRHVFYLDKDMYDLVFDHLGGESDFFASFHLHREKFFQEVFTSLTEDPQCTLPSYVLDAMHFQNFLGISSITDDRGLSIDQSASNLYARAEHIDQLPKVVIEFLNVVHAEQDPYARARRLAVASEVLFQGAQALLKTQDPK